MKQLLLFAGKNAFANRSRFSFTITAVALSVAFLTATLILADSLTGTAESDIATANADLSFVVEGAVIVEGEGGPGEALEKLTETIPIETVATVSSVDGVADAAGVISSFAKLVSDGEAVGGGTAADVGRNWIVSPDLNPFTIAEGRAPTSPTEVVLDVGLATDGAILVGDTVEVLTPTGLYEMTVTGLAQYGTASSAPLQRTLFFDDATAATIMDESGYDLVRVTIDNGANLADVIGATGESVDPAVPIDAATYIADGQNAVASPFAFLSLFLVAFAAIATVAGGTIIVNTFSIAIAQRRQELALMRAVGATRIGVLRAVLGESALIAVLATGLGIGVGVLSADGLRAVMNIAGLSFTDGPMVLTGQTLLIAMVVGLAVTIGSAWAPARAAASAAPVEALREASTEPPGLSRSRTIAGLIALAAGGAALIGAVSTTDSLLLIGGVLIVPGLVLAGPILVEGAVALVRPILTRFAGIQGSMAATNLTRNPRRSASTSLGLTLGVAMIGFFTIIASSLSASLTTTLEENVQADFFVASATAEISTIDPTLIDRINDIDGVTAASPITLADASQPGGFEAVVGGVDADMAQLFDFGVTAGSLDDLGRTGGVAVWSGSEGVMPKVGDMIELTFEDGAVSLPVVALFDDSISGFDPPTHLVAAETLDAAQSGLLDNTLFIAASPSAEEAVKATVAETPGSLFQTRSSYLASASSGVDSIRNLVYALLGLTAIIAVVGVANTTALSISERVRELGLLRAMGTTQRSVRRIVRYEAAVLSTLGTITGMAIACVGSWALVRTVGGSDISSVSIPWDVITLISLGAIVAGVLAAAGPAWRASRQPTLDAIAGR